MGSKAPEPNPNPGLSQPITSPPPPCRAPSNQIEVNGITFSKDEIKSVTIERNGTEIYIPRADAPKKTGFASHE